MKHFLFFTTLLILMSQALSGQIKPDFVPLSETEYTSQPYWQNMMLDRNISFFETQKAFYAWWADKEPSKGEGYSVFKRWEHYWETRVNEKGEFPDPGTTCRLFPRSLCLVIFP